MWRILEAASVTTMPDNGGREQVSREPTTPERENNMALPLGRDVTSRHGRGIAEGNHDVTSELLL